MRILLIDDNPDDRRVLRRYLRRVPLDVQVVEVGTAEEGVERLGVESFDVVLVDQHMPGHDGLWAIARIRELGEPGPAVVMLTGSGGDLRTSLQAIALGAEDFLLKDQIRPDGLRVAVQNALLRRKLTTAKAALDARLRSLQDLTGALLSATTLPAIDGVLAAHGPGVIPFASHRLWVAEAGRLHAVAKPELEPDELIATALEKGATERRGDRLVVPLEDGSSGKVHGMLDLIGLEEPGDEGDQSSASLTSALAKVSTQAVIRTRHVGFERQLLGIVSHDLRSPLFTITMSSALLREDASLSDGHRRIVERMARAGSAASRMVGDLLDFTRVELAGGLPLDVTPVEVLEVLEEAAEGARGRVVGRTIVVEADGAPVARVDRDRILQALGNLLDNALKFGAPETPITLTSTVEGDELRLSVHNHGPAIPPEARSRLFEANVQGDTDRKRDGLGLGLYIVRQIASAHGGSVDLDSSEERGTTFLLRLPGVVVG